MAVAESSLPVSSRDLWRFTPEGSEAVYHVQVPSIMGEARWRRDVAATGAKAVAPERSMEFLRDAASALLADDARTAALRDLDTIAELRDRQSQNGEKLTEDEVRELGTLLARMAELEEWAQREWPPYAELSAQQEFWWATARIIAAKHFLRAWEGVDAELKFHGGVVSEESLHAIPRAHVFAIGLQAIMLMRPSHERRKN